jgi:hypothetical protein
MEESKIFFANFIRIKKSLVNRGLFILQKSKSEYNLTTHKTEKKRVKIYVVLFTNGAERREVKKIQEKNLQMILQNNHLFFYDPDVFKNFQASKIVEFTVEGDTTNLPQFVFDYFHGGSQIYFSYEHGKKYVCFIPRTDADMEEASIRGILGYDAMIQDNWIVVHDNGRNIKTFRTLFPYSTQIFCVHEEGKELKKYLDFIQSVDIVIPHRVYHIPDRRGARPS